MCAVIRGHLQRKRYCGVLTERLKAREQKKRIEHFSSNFKESCVVRRITLPDRPVAAWRKESGVLDREGEGKKRLELALQLREMYQAQQNEWERFRRAEGQRRIDKANRLKAEQLAMILAQSQERRRHIDECNTYTMSLRVQTRAATCIQRSYRHWKQETACRRKLLEMLQLKKRTREDAAARRIQIAWRSYQRHCSFLARYYRIIPTAPTVVPQRSCPLDGHSTVRRSVSFMDRTLTTGQPRHKLNFTLQSGFKVINRPATSLAHPTKRQLDQARTPQERISAVVSPTRLVRLEKQRPWYEAVMGSKRISTSMNAALSSPQEPPWCYKVDPRTILPSLQQKTAKNAKTRTLTLPDIFHFPPSPAKVVDVL